MCNAQAVADAVRDEEANFRPESGSLVERYYGTRAAYIAALEQQAIKDREAVSSAPDEAPDDWRLRRLINAATCETKARLERAALAQAVRS